MIIPSMTRCGLRKRMSRSLNVPGSPSSALQTRVSVARQIARDERPFEAGRESRAAAPAQSRGFDFGQQFGRRSPLAQDFFQSGIAADFAVGGDVG